MVKMKDKHLPVLNKWQKLRDGTTQRKALLVGGRGGGDTLVSFTSNDKTMQIEKKTPRKCQDKFYFESFCAIIVSCIVLYHYINIVVRYPCSLNEEIGK